MTTKRQAFHRPASAIMMAGLTLPKLPPEAACADKSMTPDDWFPDNGRIPEVVKRVCRGCTVQAECLEAGLHEKHGVWGGLSEPERATLAGRYTRPPAAPASPTCGTCGETFRNARSRAGHQPYCRKATSR